jgi:hypothetical protein
MIWAVIVPLWIACGIAGALIAPLRGRPAWVGGVVGLVFGPLGVLVIAMLSKPKPRDLQAEMDRKSWRVQPRHYDE